MLKKRLASLAVASLTLMALGLASVGQASASTIETGGTAFRAIYGFPPGSATEPIGGGVGRNYGFGENMLFEACTSCGVGTNLDITLEGKVLESAEGYIGGTLMSNTTGESTIGTEKVENPLSFAIQFADLQHNTVAGAAAPAYADTADRPWIAEICGEKATCKVDPRLAGKAFQVQIQDVSLNIGPGEVVQGTAWATWANGTATEPACLTLTLPPAALSVDTLVETQGPKPGEVITAVSGKACLISANNDYYRSEPKKTPAVVIK
jgi:hypothetical protein